MVSEPDPGDPCKPMQLMLFALVVCIVVTYNMFALLHFAASVFYTKKQAAQVKKTGLLSKPSTSSHSDMQLMAWVTTGE